MASKPPTQCCLNCSKHPGTPQGSISNTYGLNTYKVGSSKTQFVVIAPDIYGFQLTNTQLIADKLAAQTGYSVLIPDLFEGDACPNGCPDIMKWLQPHLPEKTIPVFNEFLTKLKAEFNPTDLVGIGYCYGAKMVIANITSTGLFDIGCVAHPSFVSLEEIEKVSKPFLISAAIDDQSFTPELRHQTEEILTKVDAVYQIDLFSHVSHGFACKGDLSKPLVKYAADKALSDQVLWIKTFQN